MLTFACFNSQDVLYGVQSIEILHMKDKLSIVVFRFAGNVAKLTCINIASDANGEYVYSFFFGKFCLESGFFSVPRFSVSQNYGDVSNVLAGDIRVKFPLTHFANGIGSVGPAHFLLCFHYDLVDFCFVIVVSETDLRIKIVAEEAHANSGSIWTNIEDVDYTGDKLELFFIVNIPDAGR